MHVLTAPAWHVAARRAAAGLWQRGARPGDRVAVVTPEHRIDQDSAARLQADVIAVVTGALRAGIMPVLVNPLLTPGERAYILHDADPVLTLVEPADLTAVVSSAAPVPDLSEVPLGRPMHYTSGTTGQPKGVWTGDLDARAAGLLWDDEQDQWDFRAEDITLVHGPLCHAAPLRYAMLVLRQGGTAILPGWFDAAGAVSALARYRPTHAFMVPSHLQRMFSLDLPPSPYRLITHAGSTCPPSIKRRLHDWAGSDRVWEFYGSTEGQFTVCSGPEWEQRPGTVGRARPGRRLAVDQGVVWCHVPDFARFRYWGDPVKTAAAWRGDAFTVGDLGRLEHGYLFLEGRREDLIISGGVNVYPAEVEAALITCPGVREVAVFGMADDLWGQRVCAAFVGPADPDDVAAFAAERLAGYKRPKAVHRLVEIPHNASGKVERLKLPALLGGA